MEITILLVGIVAAAVFVVMRLFMTVRHEAQKMVEESVVPITDISEIVTPALKSEAPVFSSEALEQEAGSIIPLSVEPAASLKSDAAEQEVFQLREEVQLIREKAVIQARNALEVISKLRAENDRLKEEHAVARQDALEARSGAGVEADHLKAENAAFREQLNVAEIEIKRFTEDALALRAEMIALRGASVVKDDEGQAAAIQKMHDEYQSQLKDFYGQIEAARAAVGVLEKERDSARSRVLELEAARRVLEEKNKYYQYELTKSRAQAVGLERMFEGSCKQIDGLHRRLKDSGQDEAGFSRQGFSAVS
ncbi:MAG: hypothetical protein HQL19_07305 [Candidatus Omnitrophica bacterium]|nr:hypothetical protein [Candidatus Omnitrophota bacterium]